MKFRLSYLIKSLFFLVLFFSVNSVFAQQMFKEKGNLCALKFDLEDDEMYINYEPNDSIMVYDFLEGLDDKKMKKLKGVVMAQVMIDTADNVCCVSYTKKGNLPNKKPDVISRIEGMRGWKKNVPNSMIDKNICALIIIYFDKYEYKIQHIGYNRNKGKHIIKSNIYKRKKKHINYN